MVHDWSAKQCYEVMDFVFGGLLADIASSLRPTFTIHFCICFLTFLVSYFLLIPHFAREIFLPCCICTRPFTFRHSWSVVNRSKKWFGEFETHDLLSLFGT
jgi:hypothetical protein